MWSYVIGAVALGVLCGGWALVQGWIAKQDPEVRGPESGCHGDGSCGSCGKPEGACKKSDDSDVAKTPGEPTP